MEMMAGDELFDQIIEKEQYPEDEAAVLICQVFIAPRQLWYHLGAKCYKLSSREGNCPQRFEAWKSYIRVFERA